MSKTPKTEAYKESLKEKINALVAISETDLNAIVNHFEYRLIPKGGLLLKEGELCDTWGFVHSGMLRVYSTKSNGSEITNWFIKEDDFFVEPVSFFKGNSSLEGAAALEDTVIGVVNPGTLQQLVDSYPVFDKFTRLIYQDLILEIKESTLSRIHLNARDRYVRLMQSRPDVVKRVPLKYIASYIDITDSTLSRIRRKLMNKA